MTYLTELVELLPYVKRQRVATTCDGYRSMSFKARRDPELRERYRCRRPAYWRFRGLKRTIAERRQSVGGRDGTYCWSHLLSDGIDSCVKEVQRHRRAWNQRIEEVNELRQRYGYPRIELDEDDD